eukprot:TRINITY_DN1412_c0_g1_i1.p2 TRINITY_DN1412_c0_g1~~TRINITY_DN1412_c0_g1_i1.p2  ORF type:complete len:345 (-),score=102.27 TRINITY_DN1412_c0_g1_i1:86-1120(-)
MEDHIRTVEFTIDTTNEATTHQGILKMVKEGVEHWKSLNDDDIAIKAFTGGVTNKLFHCANKHKEKDDILVRIYGNNTDMLIDRNQELKNLYRLHETGLGPKVFIRFKNGFVYEFFQGVALTAKDLQDGHYTEKIAQKMAEWHAQDVITTNVNRTPKLWTTLHQWLDLIPDSYKDPKKDAILQELDPVKLKKEAQFLEEALTKGSHHVCFCHNDMLGPNMIVNPEKPDELHFIDYEYATHNYRAFDIANHFNEYAGFELAYEHYPKKERQYQFFRAYLGEKATEENLHEMYVEVNQFSLASHFFWGVWGLIQTDISDIKFDFLDYGKQRFAQYYKTKDQMLSLK